MFQMNIGKLIKTALNTKKMSQVDLAQRINVTPAQISRIISGERGTSIETLILIADALGIQRDFILKVASGLNTDEQSEGDDLVEILNQKINMLTPGTRAIADRLLDALLEEDKPKAVNVGKTVKSAR